MSIAAGVTLPERYGIEPLPGPERARGRARGRLWGTAAGHRARRGSGRHRAGRRGPGGGRRGPGGGRAADRLSVEPGGRGGRGLRFVGDGHPRTASHRSARPPPSRPPRPRHARPRRAAPGAARGEPRRGLRRPGAGLRGAAGAALAAARGHRLPGPRGAPAWTAPARRGTTRRCRWAARSPRARDGPRAWSSTAGRSRSAPRAATSAPLWCTRSSWSRWRSCWASTPETVDPRYGED